MWRDYSAALCSSDGQGHIFVHWWMGQGRVVSCSLPHSSSLVTMETPVRRELCKNYGLTGTLTQSHTTHAVVKLQQSDECGHTVVSEVT